MKTRFQFLKNNWLTISTTKIFMKINLLTMQTGFEKKIVSIKKCDKVTEIDSFSKLYR